jgi:hypothetical protein
MWHIRLVRVKERTAMANNLWTAFLADNGSNEVLSASLPEGGSWTASAPTYQTSQFSPSMAWFNNTLYVAFITDDEDSVTKVPSNRIFLCSTTDGVTWNPATYFNQHSKCAPSLAVWNGKLHIAFVANEPSDTIQVYFSSTPGDANSWSATVDTKQTSAMAPALAAFAPAGGAGKLYLAFVAENGSEEIIVCSLAVGGAWTQEPPTRQTCHFSPALAAGKDLYLIFAASNPSKDLYLCSLNSDGSWSATVPVNQSTSATPCAAAFGSEFAIEFVANSPSGELLLSQSANPTTSWTGGNVPLGQQSATGPTIAVAPIANTPVAPGPTAGRNNYLITNHNLVNPLRNITVTVVATQDFVNTDTYNAVDYAPVDNPVSPGGFSFQLNCQPPGTIEDPATGQLPAPGQPNYTGPYPPHGANVWGQYGIAVEGTQFSMWYENSLNGGLGPVYSQNLFTLPKANTIPKGWKIEMKLVTDPSANNNVSQLSVNVWDENGNPVKGGPGSPTDGPWTLTCSFQPAPMLNLQCNIGGPDDGQYAKFAPDTTSFPLLTISYHADDPLMVRAATNPETAENADVTFTPMAQYPANPILQYCISG